MSSSIKFYLPFSFSQFCPLENYWPLSARMTNAEHVVTHSRNGQKFDQLTLHIWRASLILWSQTFSVYCTQGYRVVSTVGEPIKPNFKSPKTYAIISYFRHSFRTFSLWWQDGVVFSAVTYFSDVLSLSWRFWDIFPRVFCSIWILRIQRKDSNSKLYIIFLMTGMHSKSI